MIKAVIFDRTGVLLNDYGQRNEPLLEWIRNLHRTYKTAILSNASSDGIRRYFSEAELASDFDATITSGEIGSMKPEPEIFLRACEKLGVEPAECVFVDDNQGHCEAARDIGMQAVWYQNLDQAKKEIEQLLNNPER